MIGAAAQQNQPRRRSQLSASFRKNIMKIGNINNLPWYARLGIFGGLAILVYVAFWYFVTKGTRKDTKGLQDQIALLQKANAEMQIASQRLNEFRTTYKNKQEERSEERRVGKECRSRW